MDKENKNNKTKNNLRKHKKKINLKEKFKNIDTKKFVLTVIVIFLLFVNLYQYTDMALFIDSPQEEKTLENTLKSVSINNIKFTKVPEMGTPNLYYKNIYNFAKSDIIDSNLINDKLDFTITSDDEANLDTPTLYNNLANPIVLSYVNSNIKTDYTLTDTSSPITYDGTLLKKCGVLLNPISSSLSFDINITNNLDQEFKCTVYLDIPLESAEQSIYDGSVTLKENTNFIFYRYK